MGVVYRARDTKLGRDVAIKVLPELVTADAERRARFSREAHLFATVNHPHIGGIYGLEESSGVTHFRARADRRSRRSPNGSRGGRFRSPSHSTSRASSPRHWRPPTKGHCSSRSETRQYHAQAPRAHRRRARQSLDFGLAKPLTIRVHSATPRTHRLAHCANTRGRDVGTAFLHEPRARPGPLADKRTDIWAFGCVCSRCFRAAGGSTARM